MGELVRIFYYLGFLLERASSAALASPSLAQPFSKTLLNPSGTDFLDEGVL